MKNASILFAIVLTGSPLFAIPSRQEAELIAQNLFKPLDIMVPRVAPSGKYLVYMGFAEETGKKRIYSLDLGTLDDEKWEVRFRYDWRPQYEVSGYSWVDGEHLFYWCSSQDIFGGGSNYSPGSLSGGKEVVIDDVGGVSLLDPLITRKRYSLYARYRSGALKKADPFPDVLQIDMETGSFIEKVMNPGNIESWMTDNKGVVRLGFFDAGAGAGLIYREDESDDWNEIEAPAPYTFVREGDKLDEGGLGMRVKGFFQGDDKLIVLVENKEGLFGLQLLDLETLTLVGKPIFREPFSLSEGYVFHEYSKGLPIGYAYWGERKERIFFDKGYRQLADSLDKALPETENTILGFTENGKYALVLSESDRQPGVISKLNMKKSGLDPLMVMRPWIDREKLSEMRPITFEARDGETIYGYLTPPVGKELSDGPFPFLTLVHGGPTTRDRWGFNEEVQFFARMGFAVMQVNYRGSTGYGSDYKGPTWLYAAEKGVHDVADGARWAIEEGIADREKVFIHGASFGGYATAMGLIEEPDLYKAGVSTMGVYDWEMIRDEDLERGYAWVDEIFADWEDKKDEYRRWSPRHQAERLKSPILILHGGLDPRVNVNQSRRFADALEAADVPYEMKVTRWMQHGFMDYGDNAMVQYYLDIADFFRKYL
ncbi:MAG: alpha/beta hydrolase family protein [Oceanipulchritudo sp.]